MVVALSYRVFHVGTRLVPCHMIQKQPMPQPCGCDVPCRICVGIRTSSLKTQRRGSGLLTTPSRTTSRWWRSGHAAEKQSSALISVVRSAGAARRLARKCTRPREPPNAPTLLPTLGILSPIQSIARGEATTIWCTTEGTEMFRAPLPSPALQCCSKMAFLSAPRSPCHLMMSTI